MDKNIIIKMEASKDIIIYIEGGKKITILKDDRSIKADDVYRLINYSRGDKYSVKSLNEENIDVPALKFFEELIKEIINKLNSFSNSDEDDCLSNINSS